MASSLADLCDAVETSENAYESRFNPVAMGNMAAIAYGGCALGFAVNAASKTVTEGYRLYSALGHFLGPALTDRKLRCLIRRTRSTRSFATRTVEIFQKLDNGQDRMVMFLVTDFHAREPESMFTYSAQPFLEYGPLETAISPADSEQRLIADGVISESVVKIVNKLFAPMRQYTDQRTCTEGIMAQNMAGILKKAKTTQDHLPLADKTSADWLKSKQKLQDHVEHVTALTFVMDGAVSFIPLTHDHKFLDDASACSSLDFALRFFTNDIAFNDWHLRELRTVTGGEGRTYSEARLWNEKGVMVASMSQQAICRPRKPRQTRL